MSRARDWPQQIGSPTPVLGNFRPSKAERSKPKIRKADLRPGMSPRHLACIRQLPCTVCPARCHSDAHHLKSGPARFQRGTGLRATDRYAVPLCRLHHDEVENEGSRKERLWFLNRGIDPLELADALWLASGDPDDPMTIDAMREVLDGHKRAAIRMLADRRRKLVVLDPSEWRRS